MNREEAIKQVSDRLRDTLIAKNRAYGDTASRSPVLIPNLPAEVALLVRMSDKINRLSTLLSTNTDDNGESIDDTVLDLAGYCVLYLAGKE